MKEWGREGRKEVRREEGREGGKQKRRKKKNYDRCRSIIDWVVRKPPNKEKFGFYFKSDGISKAMEFLFLSKDMLVLNTTQHFLHNCQWAGDLCSGQAGKQGVRIFCPQGR